MAVGACLWGGDAVGMGVFVALWMGGGVMMGAWGVFS